MSLLRSENAVFAAYGFWSAVAVGKTVAMIPLLAYRKFSGGNPKATEEALNLVQANHRNDLENVPLFLGIGLLYVLSDPSPATALWHFRIFGVSRLVHTLAMQTGVKPARGAAFMAGFCVIASMAAQVAMKFY